MQVTPEMIERAAKMLMDSMHGIGYWDTEAARGEKSHYRVHANAMLRAALAESTFQPPGGPTGE